MLPLACVAGGSFLFDLSFYPVLLECCNRFVLSHVVLFRFFVYVLCTFISGVLEGFSWAGGARVSVRS